jgi:hypothetical protein
MKEERKITYNAARATGEQIAHAYAAYDSEPPGVAGKQQPGRRRAVIRQYALAAPLCRGRAAIRCIHDYAIILHHDLAPNDWYCDHREVERMARETARTLGTRAQKARRTA